MIHVNGTNMELNLVNFILTQLLNENNALFTKLCLLFGAGLVTLFGVAIEADLTEKKSRTIIILKKQNKN